MPRLTFQSREEEGREAHTPVVPGQGSGSRPGKKALKIAECKIREHLKKGKGKRKETAKMGNGNESGGREESTKGKKSGLIKEGQSLEWKRSVKESPS